MNQFIAIRGGSVLTDHYGDAILFKSREQYEYACEKWYLSPTHELIKVVKCSVRMPKAKVES